MTKVSIHELQTAVDQNHAVETFLRELVLVEKRLLSAGIEIPDSLADVDPEVKKCLDALVQFRHADRFICSATAAANDTVALNNYTHYLRTYVDRPLDVPVSDWDVFLKTELTDAIRIALEPASDGNGISRRRLACIRARALSLAFHTYDRAIGIERPKFAEFDSRFRKCEGDLREEVEVVLDYCRHVGPENAWIPSKPKLFTVLPGAIDWSASQFPPARKDRVEILLRTLTQTHDFGRRIRSADSKWAQRLLVGSLFGGVGALVFAAWHALKVFDNNFIANVVGVALATGSAASLSVVLGKILPPEAMAWVSSGIKRTATAKGIQDANSRLQDIYRESFNLVVLGPRGNGKSSLVLDLAEYLKTKNSTSNVSGEALRSLIEDRVDAKCETCPKPGDGLSYKAWDPQTCAAKNHEKTAAQDLPKKDWQLKRSTSLFGATFQLSRESSFSNVHLLDTLGEIFQVDREFNKAVPDQAYRSSVRKSAAAWHGIIAVVSLKAGGPKTAGLEQVLADLIASGPAILPPLCLVFTHLDTFAEVDAGQPRFDVAFGTETPFRIQAIQSERDYLSKFSVLSSQPSNAQRTTALADLESMANAQSGLPAIVLDAVSEKLAGSLGQSLENWPTGVKVVVTGRSTNGAYSGDQQVLDWFIGSEDNDAENTPRRDEARLWHKFVREQLQHE